jgi:hypothetical protein
MEGKKEMARKKTWKTKKTTKYTKQKREQQLQVDDDEAPRLLLQNKTEEENEQHNRFASDVSMIGKAARCSNRKILQTDRRCFPKTASEEASPSGSRERGRRGRSIKQQH